VNTAFQGFLLLTLLLLAGCAVHAPIDPPRPESRVPEAPPVNPAVASLMEKARAQNAVGQPDLAGASLERALRIEPRNPVVWQELARVRLSQGQYLQAEHLAAKSSSLAGNDRTIRAENWRIIGQARSRRGDVEGAQEAFVRAEERP
jgi:predicted Zn-dependent protease